MHVGELLRMGANIRVDGRTAVVEGVDKLQGAIVKTTDLRAGASLIIAGLMAYGDTEVTNISHIDRGYVNIDGKLRELGAIIEKG
jgi:UDP-N-acetylglucosamine 1-carboxyvinyltransferase